jgi:hypothetical protein
MELGSCMELGRIMELAHLKLGSHRNTQPRLYTVNSLAGAFSYA